MRYSQGHNLPILEDNDVADLNDYSEKVAEALENATGAQDERIDEQLQNMTLEDPSSAEIVDARGGFPLLRYRLNASDTKLNKKVYYHNNVANMKADNSLSAGDVVQTLGYYSVDDGGQGLYQIVDDDTLVDDGGSVHDLVSGLKAKLIVDNFVNVKQMGAKGDGITDDTAKIQLAFNKYKNILINDGTYMINAETSVFPKSNSKIILSKNAILKAITTSSSNYIIVSFNNVSNINFEGGQILGDVDTHIGSTGEWGMGISINHNASNIYIKETYISKCWGDGIYINLASNIITEKVVSKYNRRQGLSIISVDGYISINDEFSETSGTAPEAGVDIEPNLTTDILNNILFINPKTKNNSGAGIQIYITKELTSSINIKIINHFDYGSQDGLGISKVHAVTGKIDIIEPFYDMNKYRGIASGGYFGNNNCPLTIKKLKITNCNQSNQTAFNYSIPICFYNTTSDTENAIGNIYIIEPFLDNPNQTNQCCIGIRNSSKVEKVKIFNPIFARGSVWCDNDLILEDINKVFVAKSNYDWPISAVSIRSIYSNSNATANRTYSINNNVPKNFKFNIVNNNTSSKILDIQLGSNLICRNFSTTAGIKIRLANFGDSITFEKISDTELLAMNIVGNPTVVS